MCLHFQNALKLRKLERYDEAGEELKLTNDPEGRVHLGYAYLYGGFGIDRDVNKGIEILLQTKHPWARAVYESYAFVYNLPFQSELDLESKDPFVLSVHIFMHHGDTGDASFNTALKACEQGIPFVIYFLRFAMVISTQFFHEYLYKFADNGDALSQRILGSQNHNYVTSFYWLNRSASQKCFFAYYDLALCMEDMHHPDILKMTRMFILSGIPEPIELEMTDEMRYQSMYLYGQYGGFFCNEYLKKEAIDIYRKTTEKARLATLCWMWIARGVFYKDLAKMIGKMVYESRYKPAEWI